MSKHKNMVEVTPPETANAQQNGEAIVIHGFRCPVCAGSGHVEDINIANPNKILAPCRLCNGRGKLMARVTVKWLPNDETVIV